MAGDARRRRHRGRHQVGTSALPLPALRDDVAAECPALIKGYLRAGAYICGEPAWDADFNCADVLIMMPMSRVSPRYLKHFSK